MEKEWKRVRPGEEPGAEECPLLGNHTADDP